MQPRHVELHIEELVLHGFAPGDRYGIAAAVQVELTRLLATQGLPSRLTRPAKMLQLDGGAFDVVPGAQPDTVGTQVAQRVYQGLHL